MATVRPPMTPPGDRMSTRRRNTGAPVLAALAGMGLGLAPGVARAQEPLLPAPIEDVSELDLEALLNQGITSVSKREEKLFGAPSAIHVVRGEDIRRTGARSLPDALRMVPGMQVARQTSNLWAVASRGFADITANKLLVLIDGRSVYTPSFAGVWWDVQDVMLEDVERIEVIRGPGGALWGANAVNGVINVVTRSAADTQGTLISGGAGTVDRGFGAVRHGTTLGRGLFVRTYAKGFDWNTPDVPGDHYYQGRVGFRADGALDGGDSITLQGDYYRGDAEFTVRSPLLMPPWSGPVDGAGKVSGGNVLGRWQRTWGPRSELSAQLYYDHTARSGELHGERRHTVDLELQHRFPLLQRHDLMWGLGYRVARDEIDDSFTISFDPQQHVQQLASAFFQDQMSLLEDRLRFTVGGKLEHHQWTGFEWQPSARVGYTPNQRHALWAAVSRAVRTPARNERDVRVNRSIIGAEMPVLFAIFGSRGFRSEVLWAYEAGYRVKPLDPITLDATVFHDDYTRLRTLEPQMSRNEETPAPPHVLVPLLAQNRMSGWARGAEVTARWQARSWWRLELSYSYIDMDLEPEPGSADISSEKIEGQSPPHQVYLRSSFDLPGGLELDGMYQYVHRLPALPIDGYHDLDVRLGWRSGRHWEVALVGQNLVGVPRQEWQATLLTLDTVKVHRAFHATVTARF